MTAVYDDDLKQWYDLPWKKITYKIEKLQKRLAEAAHNQDWSRVRKLQKLILHSHYAHLLAVHRVTMKTQKRTPGIDKKFWHTTEERFDAVEYLKNNWQTHHFSPLMRVIIPKDSDRTKTRPLSVPKIIDRAMQALYLLAIDPVVEEIADTHAYGFRKNRSAQDAIKDIRYNFDLLNTRTWVAKADIHECFDHVSHEWLIENTPFIPERIANMLSCGYISKHKYHPITEGVPQGGVISPVLSTIALSGFEKILTNKYGNSVKIVRFVDDYLFASYSPKILKDVIQDLQEFLSVRNLSLSQNKTQICHISEGVNFIGWFIVKYHDRLIFVPSKKSYDEVIHKLKEKMRQGLAWEQDELISKINDLINGWGLYHNYACAPDLFMEIDDLVLDMTWKWCKTKNPNMTEKQLYETYFYKESKNNLMFGSPEKHILKMSDLRVGDTINPKSFKNPYIYRNTTINKKRVVWDSRDNNYLNK